MKLVYLHEVKLRLKKNDAHFCQPAFKENCF